MLPLLPILLLSVAPPPTAAPAVTDLAYTVRFDRRTAAAGRLEITTTFRTDAPGPVVLSLPAWTPGSYELDNFARYVSGFEATAGGQPAVWDKTDYDSWRIQVPAAGPVQVRFVVTNDTLDVGMAGVRGDAAYFNGTNVFLYPEGQGLQFPTTVTVETERDWLIATGMTPGARLGTYTAPDYHDLVDMPFLVGAIELDSMEIDGVRHRLATHPRGAMTGADRADFWHYLRQLMPPMAAVFGETPFDTYTTMIVFDGAFPGMSALEHTNSHLGTYNTAAVGSATLLSITAHEIFHAWNVKRLRPEDLWPYRYDTAQPTALLWISEGITDYYADLAMLRAGVWNAAGFYQTTSGKITNVAQTAPVALEDASLSTWIDPADGSGFIYYDKGSLAGFLLDILIRDATANRASLDDVLRALYRSEYQGGSGFTNAEWWAATERVAGRSFTDFHRRYVDGREPFPYDSVLPRAGLALDRSADRRAYIDIEVDVDSAGIRVSRVAPGSAAERGGLREGDYLIRLDGVAIPDVQSAVRVIQGRAASPDGTVIPVEVRRNGQSVALRMELGFAEVERFSLREDPRAPPGAVRVRNGILRGTTGG